MRALAGGTRGAKWYAKSHRNSFFLGQLWPGRTTTFVSTFEYDGIATWQAFSFLVDLGPVYTLRLVSLAVQPTINHAEDAGHLLRVAVDCRRKLLRVQEEEPGLVDGGVS